MPACHLCGASMGLYGYGWPGPHSKKPQGKRGFLWACAECRPQAEARWSAATGQKSDNPQPQQGTEWIASRETL
jgi:hypothetical protein